VAGSALIEIPVTTVEWAGRRMAAGGGGFFRLFPYALSRWALTRVNRHDTRPALTYFHPWEIDPDQPRVAGAPWRSRLRHYSRLGAMAGKLRRLLHDFSWGRMDALAEAEARRLP
jgi:polysaccharide deacetylase family protein (PEP-CTERM system associated)